MPPLLIQILEHGRRFFTFNRVTLSVMLCAAIVMGWQNLLYSPDSLPKARVITYDYPDIFQLREDYFNRFDILHHKVSPGDNFYTILEKFHLRAACSLQWQKECQEFCRLNHLRPGDQLFLYVDKRNRKPFKVVYIQNQDDAVFVFRNREGRWECEKQPDNTIRLDQTAKGIVTDNLYDSCLRAKLPPCLIMTLVDLFSFDIDFNTDLRSGDSFSVYYEQRVRDGKRVAVGPILAAKMTINGTPFRAFYYTLPDGYSDYFDMQGRSLRKLFLKAPLKYRRISSTFTYKRFHPILKIYRPHLGIDYAAPTGTPVNALGDGKVIFKGRNGGFGNFIALSHGAHYKTTYGHLCRFAKGLKVGSRVKQGQVIGYVGSTGLATGPHLDFRFYKDGKPINFLKTRFPHARSIPKQLLADFQLKRQQYLAALGGTNLAKQ